MAVIDTTWRKSMIIIKLLELTVICKSEVKALFALVGMTTNNVIMCQEFEEFTRRCTFNTVKDHCNGCTE